METTEVNFDGLVGPTHNYAGLAFGNRASLAHRWQRSSPRRAALQGLAKMKLLLDLGLVQAVLPPHERPAIDWLRRLGFAGNDAAVLGRARRVAPELLAAASSAAAMWAANACTTTPSADAADGRVHFTVANLASEVHRSLESVGTERILHAIFRDPDHFTVHPAIEPGVFGDEGAANHTRFCREHGSSGFHLFTYGKTVCEPARGGPSRFPARQSLQASQTIARQHGLSEGDSVIFLQQNPEAIDAGAFHHDLLAVGHRLVHLCHEQALLGGAETLARLGEAAARRLGCELVTLLVTPDRLTLDEAVHCYLFNSQIVSLTDGSMALVAAEECRQSVRARSLLEELVADRHSPIRRVLYVDLTQSMANGGGPACLRQRVVLSSSELSAMAPGVLLTEARHAALVAWVNRHYREVLSADELADPALLEESRRALDELTQLLGLGSIYAFQSNARA